MGLFDAFLGNSQRDDLVRGRSESEAALAAARDTSIGTRKDYLDKSVEFLTPQIGAGTDSLNLLRAAFGLDGRDDQMAFYRDFETDPGFDTATKAGIDAFEGSAAARGGLFSGNAIKGITDFASRRRNDAYNTRINQLLGLYGQGAGASSGAAGLTADAGSQIADTQFGTGQFFANNATNFANAMAQSRGIPINNLLGVLGAGAKVVGAFNGVPAS